MYQLIFATNNAHKIAEIQSLVGPDFTIIDMKSAGINIDIPEPRERHSCRWRDPWAQPVR